MDDRRPPTLRRRALRTAALALLPAALLVSAPTVEAADDATLPASAPAPTTTTPPAPPASDTYDHRVEEGFASASWWRDWGLGSAPLRTGIITGRGESALGIRVEKGTHDGTSWMLPTGDADDVHVQYRLRLPKNWDVSGTASNFKLPGFGNPVRDRRGVCLSGCGGRPADGVRSYSARGDVDFRGRNGWYIYHAAMPQTATSYGMGLRWWGRQEPLQADRWYTIDLRIQMNTPGEHDGVLQAWIDGTNVSDIVGLRFRDAASLHVGAAWFDFYFGGSGVARENMILLVDDIVVEW